jgi:UDP-N-acetylmuramyl pentapeptide phosphotransferase/UDP-N-acetylglucosamine-1-phosphate transferase
LVPIGDFSNFILDATLTLMKRLLRRERVWEAHREHYYQRLIRMGMSHQKTALIEYCLMIISGILAVLALQVSTLYAVELLVLCLSIQLILMRLLDIRWQRYV